MAETVNAIAGSLVDAPDYRVPTDTEEAPSGELGKDAFLKLLVAQLKYQDPLEPSSSEDFIATTAQFTVVEKLDELTKQGANTQLVNSLTTASALIGRQITATQGSDATVTAVVNESRIISGQVMLQTDQGEIGLDQIISVGAPPAPPTPPATPSRTAEVTAPAPIEPPSDTANPNPVDQRDEADQAGDVADVADVADGIDPVEAPVANQAVPIDEPDAATPPPAPTTTGVNVPDAAAVPANPVVPAANPSPAIATAVSSVPAAGGGQDEAAPDEGLPAGGSVPGATYVVDPEEPTVQPTPPTVDPVEAPVPGATYVVDPEPQAVEPSVTAPTEVTDGEQVFQPIVPVQTIAPPIEPTRTGQADGTQPTATTAPAAIAQPTDEASTGSEVSADEIATEEPASEASEAFDPFGA